MRRTGGNQGELPRGQVEGYPRNRALATAENIRKAAILAAYSGADFIKTSTGKGYPGATPEATYIICRVIKQYYEQTGRKSASGFGRHPYGRRCGELLTIVKETLGSEWLGKDLFRIGASSLVADIERRLGK